MSWPFSKPKRRTVYSVRIRGIPPFPITGGSSSSVAQMLATNFCLIKLGETFEIVNTEDSEVETFQLSFDVDANKFIAIQVGE